MTARSAGVADLLVPPPMSTELDSNKDVMRRFSAEAINGRDLDAVDRLLTVDFTHDGEQRGRTGPRAAVDAFLDGFADLHNDIVLLLAEGDLVAAHQRWTGTHTGSFAGIAATGNTVSFTSAAVLRLANGLIAAAWDEVDMVSLMGQLQPPCT